MPLISCLLAVASKLCCLSTVALLRLELCVLAGVCSLEWRPHLRREITLCFCFAVLPAIWLLDYCIGEDRFSLCCFDHFD
ncbi:hypothetical protein RHGRI_036578 [Rhododendron griersonianum]|uniref:Secreted protein n=1 Tax=Rhododendron griersonianum TaxID=479676 RepID=A0AAV6HP05_9ERIC|nr:hypothetical protein RHGRI_036578 [Rhododendron griersonianum]